MFIHLIGVLFIVGPTHSFFQGCFHLPDWNSVTTKNLDESQNNRKCIEFCRQRYHSMAATYGVICVCVDNLPSQALTLAPSGPDSRCNAKCPGDVGTQCFRESCCGGPGNAFSMYATGDVDAVDKLMSIIVEKRDALVQMTNPGEGLFVISLMFYIRMPGNSERFCTVTFLGTGSLPTKACTDDPNVPEAYLPIPTVRFLVDSVEKELSSSGSPQSQPLGRYDVEFDNTNGQSEATLSRSREVSQTTSQTYTTETGSENSVSVGASVSAGFDAFGAEFSVELSTEFSHSSFYNYGYESANEESITDTFQISIPVAPGVRTAVRFSKRFEELTLKWRSTVYATENVKVAVLGDNPSIREISLTELLTTEERMIHGFGTIRGEAHPTVTVTIETYDANGILIGSRPATEEEAQAVSSKKRDPAKTGDLKKNTKAKKLRKHRH